MSDVLEYITNEFGWKDINIEEEEKEELKTNFKIIEIEN